MGMFQLANGGTIFLDEIGEMTAPLQVKLLRVLQEREIRPVGSDRSVKVDVRVIAASNRDLGNEVEKGRFREDLFYRLQVIPVLLPPLRERRSDIPVLVQHFLDKYNSKHEGRQCHVADDAMVHLWEYDWPGNVRELENLIERMVVLSEDGFIRVDNLPPNIRSFISEKKIPRPTLTEEGIDLNRAVEEFEYRLIDEALRRTKATSRRRRVCSDSSAPPWWRSCGARPAAAAKPKAISSDRRARSIAMNEQKNGSAAHGRILIVDDDPNTLEILRRWLNREGYSTVSADNGPACLKALGTEAVDVIVLDVMMPGMDGLQVCERLRASDAWRGIPVVLLTAKDDLETRSRGMMLGVSEYLTKPVNKLELFARLQAQLHSRELERRMEATAATVEGLEKK
jgi:DNA-binding NtrC family response regulator